MSCIYTIKVVNTGSEKVEEVSGETPCVVWSSTSVKISVGNGLRRRVEFRLTDTSLLVRLGTSSLV